MEKEGRIFVHIGIHKTGTTYLQNYFFKSLDGVDIINTPKYYQTFAKIEKTINSNFLVSNEGISGVAWNYDWHIGKPNNFHWIESFNIGINKLKFLFPNAIILVFFRKHGDLLGSMYKQYIHEGGTLKLKDFYGNEKVIRDVDLSYSTRIGTLKEKFKDVYILSYEDFRDNGDNYLRSLFMEFGIETNTIKKGKLAKNISISGKKIGMLRFLNHFYIRLPLKIRKGLRILKISPRQIVQNYLSFWKSPDSEDYIKLVNDINSKFKGDWDYFETMKWNYRKKKDVRFK